MAGIEQEGNDEFRRIGRDGQANANEPATLLRIVKRGVDTDDRTIGTDKRSARIAMVDGRIGLDVAIEWRVLQIAVQRADDSGRDGNAQPKRIPYRQHGIPHAQGFAVTPLEGRQRPASVNLDNRKIGMAATASSLAVRRSPSSRITLMSSAPSMTCLLVTIPVGSMTKPEP